MIEQMNWLSVCESIESGKQFAQADYERRVAELFE